MGENFKFFFKKRNYFNWKKKKKNFDNFCHYQFLIFILKKKKIMSKDFNKQNESLSSSMENNNNNNIEILNQGETIEKNEEEKKTCYLTMKEYPISKFNESHIINEKIIKMIDLVFKLNQDSLDELKGKPISNFSFHFLNDFCHSYYPTKMEELEKCEQEEELKENEKENETTSIEMINQNIEISERKLKKKLIKNLRNLTPSKQMFENATNKDSEFMNAKEILINFLTDGITSSIRFTFNP
jgi:hypothetical protein